MQHPVPFRRRKDAYVKNFLLLPCLLFSVSPVHARTVQLDWQTTDQPPSLTDYQEVQRGTDGLTFTTIATLLRTDTTYQDTPIEGQPTYYRIVAVNGSGSSLSNTVCGTFYNGLTPILSLPTILTGTTILSPPTVDIAGVQYQIDGVSLGPEVTTPPFTLPSFNLRTLENGTHILTEIVRNSAGGLTTVTQQITVQNGAPPILAYVMNEGAGTTVADSSGNGKNGTAAGATWTTTPGLSFTATGVKLTSPLTDHATARTYMAWVKRVGVGGGSYGRIFDKRTTGGEVEVLYVDSPDGSIKYLRIWSTGNGIWKIPVPGLNVWHHIAVVYDASLPTNKPVIYVDGIAQVVTQVHGPSGTPLTNADPYVIGNRGAGDRWLNGEVRNLKIFNQVLTASDIRGEM